MRLLCSSDVALQSVDIGTSEPVSCGLECPFPLLLLTLDHSERDFMTTYETGAREMMNVSMRRVSGMAVNSYDVLICGGSVSTFFTMALYFDTVTNMHYLHGYRNVRGTIK